MPRKNRSGDGAVCMLRPYQGRQSRIPRGRMTVGVWTTQAKACGYQPAMANDTVIGWPDDSRSRGRKAVGACTTQAEACGYQPAMNPPIQDRPARLRP